MNDDKAVQEVAEKLGFLHSARIYDDKFMEAYNLCVSLTRELQAIREAAQPIADKFPFSHEITDSEMRELCAALEGK